MRDLVWRTMLTMQMNAIYWSRFTSRYIAREKWIKIFLAVTSSGAVAGWTFWLNHAMAWKGLSSASALVAIVLPVLNYPSVIQSATKLSTKFAQLRIAYDQFWAQFDLLSQNEAQTRLTDLAAKEAEIAELGVGFSVDKTLLSRCQDEVLKSRGLI